MDTCSLGPLPLIKTKVKMELEVEVDIPRAIGNLTFDTTETDAVFLLLAHLPGFKKEDIEVQVDEAKMEIRVSGGGQVESLEFVNVDRLVNIYRVVEMGRFCDVFSIPDGVVFERIDATFDEEEEILLILMPKSGREEEEVSCDVDKEVFLKEPIPIPLPDQMEEEGNKSDEEEIPSEEIPDQMPSLPDSVENVELEHEHTLPVNAGEIERLPPQDDRGSAVEEQETPDVKNPDQNFKEEDEIPEDDEGLDSIQRQEETETTHNPLAEESDRNYQDRDGNRDVEKEDPPPHEKDADSNLVEEEREAPKDIESPETDMNFNFISEESDCECEDENPTTENEHPPRQTPEQIKLPETDTSFSLIEEQEKQEPHITQNHKSEESNLNSTLEHENTTIEAENPPPKAPESIKLPETIQNFKEDQDLPPKTSEPINPTQEREENRPESNQSTELKGPHQNLNQEDEDSDEGGEEMEMRRERKRRRVGKRSSAFPLNATSLLAGSAFLFSLVVLVFHFLRGRKQRSRN